jgi:hypothetical protein
LRCDRIKHAIRRALGLEVGAMFFPAQEHR